MASRAIDTVCAGATPRSSLGKCLSLLSLLLLSGCLNLIPKGVPPPPVPISGSNATLIGTHRGPLAAGLGLQDANARAALAAFATSCPRLTQRKDASGLTRPDDWASACAAATGWPVEDAASFFGKFFETATVARGEAFVPGY